jgi:tRNA1(Val) A37 N6-methylase TrmN6
MNCAPTQTEMLAVTLADSDVSDDAALGGRLILRQPLRGHRFGHDAILLAAAVAARSGERAVDLGAGVGTAGLAMARRVDGLAVTLVEIDPVLAGLARDNAARNDLAARVHAVCLDVRAAAAAFDAVGLAAGSADHVLMNPPFNPPHNPSPDRRRRAAHIASDDTLLLWLHTAARLLRPAGAVTLIWRADGLDQALAEVAEDFGAVTVLPIHPKPDSPAVRVLLRGEKDRNRPLTRLPGFVLADADGSPTAQAENVLREGAALPLTRSLD